MSLGLLLIAACGSGDDPGSDRPGDRGVGAIDQPLPIEPFTLFPPRTLHTASGNAAWVVEGMLERLGVGQQFGVMCGADLVGVPKGSATFFPRLLDLAGVEAADAIVVDDSAWVLSLAKAAGAATVLVSRDGTGEVDGVDLAVPSVAAFVEAAGG